MSAAKRANLRGVSRSRAGQILAGAIVAQETLSAPDVSEVEICPWALRDGIMVHYLQSLGVDSDPMPLQPIEHSDDAPGHNGNRPAVPAVIPTSSRR
jgi:exopolyphosphatase/guanosine-5'-triphosphate,3'-diphosphate pyrophosphatase